MPRILLEDTVAFKPDLKSVVESKNPTTGVVSKRVPGTLSLCDWINGNNRLYGKAVWEKNLSEGSSLRQLMARRASFGLLEHPADGKVDLRSPISHIVPEATLVEAEVDGKKIMAVHGVVEVLTGPGLPDGQKLWSLIEAGYEPLVSSRGYGTLVKSSNGVDMVQDDYVCEGWDVVISPSFAQAALKPERPAPQTEAAKETKKETVKVTENVSKTTTPAPKAGPTTRSTTMDIITKIKESISSLKAVNTASLDARGFASGLQRMSELHNEAAQALSEDSKSSWEVQQLHKEISAIEESWNASFDAPRTEVKQLKENQTKLLTVVKKLAGCVTENRKVLVDTRKSKDKATQIAETVAKRGRSWMEAAKRDHDKSGLLDKKYNFTTEALDIMASRYKADVATLGVRVLELEFPQMTEEHKTALKGCKTPGAVLAIREAIEGKKAPADKKLDESKKSESKKDAPVDKKVDEAKKPDAPADKKPDDTKAPQALEILKQDTGHSFGESVGMARRLSTSQSTFHG